MSTADIIGLDQCRALRTLNLHSNRLYETPGLGHLAMLTSLNLSSNQLEVLDGLNGLHSLEVTVLYS